MNNIKPLMKRVCAYMIDLVIVMLIASLISSIPFLNKDMEDYQKTYDEYEEKYNQYSDYIQLLEESYQDKEINEEEYTKLIEAVEYQEIISSKYEDNTITEDEYNNIVIEINKEFDSVSNDYVYYLNKQGVSNSIITLICTLLYFGLFQYFLKGQTIGKKLVKLKLVSASDKKITIWAYLLRSLIVHNVLLNTISIIFLVCTSKALYTGANNIIGGVTSLVEAIIIFMILTRQDGRGLHDLLCNTQVISTKVSQEETSKKEIKTKSTKKIIDAEYKEESEVDGKKERKTKRK